MKRKPLGSHAAADHTLGLPLRWPRLRAVQRQHFLATLLLCSLLSLTCAPIPQVEAAAYEGQALQQLLRATRLRHVYGSTVKVEQLIGDVDKQTKLPTYNQSFSRYAVLGTDLGNSFEHNGKTYFLFGDTVGGDWGDVIAVSESRDPEGPLALDFLTDAEGRVLKIEPNGVPMHGFEVPVAGVSLNGFMYVAVKTNYSRSPPEYTVLLTRFDEGTRVFRVVREMSRLPGGRFVTFTMRLAPPDLKGLPEVGPHVLIFGSGDYRRSNAYLAAVPAASFESGEGTRYFAGMNDGSPRWTDVEADAAPIIEHPTIGDLSVTYVPEIGLWLALYDGLSPRGVVLRYAPQPWGPWSAPEILWDGSRDGGYGDFIHTPFRTKDDGLAGPVATVGADPLRVGGGIYAPYIIEPFTRVEGDRLTLHYVLSTWNPYVVIRLRSTLAIERPEQPAKPSLSNRRR